MSIVSAEEGIRIMDAWDRGGGKRRFRPDERKPLTRTSVASMSAPEPETASMAEPPVMTRAQPAPVEQAPGTDPNLQFRQGGTAAAPLNRFDPNPAAVIFNNKMRPTGIEAGGDPNALLRAQQEYKAPISKKDMALQALFGFLQGGIGGAVGNVARYGLDQNYRNQQVMGRDIANTQGQIQQGVLQRNQENDLANDKSVRNARTAQMAELTRKSKIPPRVQTGKETLEDGSVIMTERHEDGSFGPAKNADGTPVVLSRPKAKVKVKLRDGREIEVDPAIAYANDNRDADQIIARGDRQAERTDREQDKAFERESQRAAAEDELNTLTRDEKEAGAQKNVAYEYLEELKKNPDVSPEDLAQARQAAQQADALYKSFGAKKAAAKGKATRYAPLTRNTGGGKYTEADVRARASNAGKDPEAAVALAMSKGLL